MRIQKEKSDAQHNIFINNKIDKYKIKGQFLLDSPREFRGINRKKIRFVLFNKGLPIPLTKTHIAGHNNAYLCGKHNGNLINYVLNNTGISQ